MDKKIIELIIGEDGLDNLGVDAIALVENPAIEKNFLYFKEEKFVEPNAGEEEGDFIGRCMGALEGEFPDGDQRLGVCYTYWEASEEEFLRENPCQPGWVAYGTKIKDGRTVPNCIPDESSKQEFESYNDYPESAKNAAKRALEWRDNHPDQSCGTRVGWARANQLAKGENISEETIARMASFARHLQYDGKPYSEGCGGLMVDAWGGKAGIQWAQNKLAAIRDESAKEVFELNLDVLGYMTENFDICPAAINLFKHLIDMNPDEDEAGMIRSAALQADAIFGIEKKALADKEATKEDLGIAIVLAKDFIDLMHEIDESLGMQHNVDWIDGHIETILSLVPDYEFDIDPSGLTPYVDETVEDEEDLTIPFPPALSAEQLDEFEELVNSLGIDKKEYEEFATVAEVQEKVDKALELPGDATILTRWRYIQGPPSNAEGPRSFCRILTSADRYYTKEEIDRLSFSGANPGFGPGGRNQYSIFKYKGGPNCRHYWQKYSVDPVTGKMSEAEPLGGDEKLAGTAPRTLSGRGYVNSSLPGLSGHSAFSACGCGCESKDYHFNEEQRIVTGPAMIPDYEMARKGDNGEKYYVYFTEETIRQINEKFMREKRLDQTNIEHDSEDIRTNNYVYESWIIEDPEMDKAKAMGFDLPKGTWMVSMRVMDNTTWDLIKDGKIKGFSVEGFFGEMVQR